MLKEISEAIKPLLLQASMKNQRIYFFILTSFLALIGLLVLQVNWIFQSAQMKEDLFHEKARMVLARTIESLQNDQATCGEIKACLENEADSNPSIGQAEIRKIDSLFQHFMRFYHFQVEYQFAVAKTGSSNMAIGQPSNAYHKSLFEFANHSPVELKLILPDKDQYLKAALGLPFYSAVFLILVVMLLFWNTVRYLMKERAIWEQTTDFLNNMTHEFKTPITNIALAGKMMTRESNLAQEEKIRHYAGIIKEENEKLRLQVDQVLEFGLLERGEIPFCATIFDVHEIIRELSGRFQPRLEDLGGILRLELAATQFHISGDKTHFTNALANLIDNAIKYGGEKPTIWVSSSNLDKQLKLVIADNGAGISSEFHQKIFEPYFRISSGDVHNVKGFGLGLAYVKKIMQLHKARIEVQSESGLGCQFKITLPYAKQ